MTVNAIDTNLHLSAFPATYVVPGYLQALGYTATTNLLIGNPLHTDPGTIRISGYFTGAGNVTQIPIGFQPTSISIIDVTNNIQWDWYRGLPATDVIKTVSTGTRTVDTTSAIVVSTDLSGNTVLTIAAATAANAAVLIYKIDG